MYFLEERLRSQTPEQMEKALNDHIDLQVLHQNLKDELKRHKKLVQEQTKALQEVERTQHATNGRTSRIEVEAQEEIHRLREEIRLEKESNEALIGERDNLTDQLRDAHSRASNRDADTQNLEREVDLLEKVLCH